MANPAVESFVFYKSFYDSTKNLKDSDKLLVFNAIFSYTFEGKEQKLKGIPAIIWTLVKPNLDASISNRINGRKGGRPKKDEESKRGVIETGKGGLLEKENPAFKKTITNGDVNEDVDVNENVDEDIPFSEELPKVPQENYEDQFNRFWEKYPSSVNKKGAKTKFVSIVKKNPDLFGKIMGGVENYLSSEKVSKGVICHATTWLNQERWEVIEKPSEKQQAVDDWFASGPSNETLSRWEEQNQKGEPIR